MSRRRVVAAWGVHLYTALGLPLAYLCAQALLDGDAQRFWLFSAVACAIDATDGFLARRVDVKTVLPAFDGRRLDDIVDFLHFVVLPMAAVPALGLVPESWAAVVVLPMMASGYGFSQDHAKTDDAFVGFPSYWNIVVLYLYVLGASPTVTIALLLWLAALVFVPIHYVYPSRTPRFFRTTNLLGWAWAAMIFALLLAPDAGWARTLAWVSLYYPAYYLVISLIHHRSVTRRAEPLAG